MDKSPLHPTTEQRDFLGGTRGRGSAVSYQQNEKKRGGSGGNWLSQKAGTTLDVNHEIREKGGGRYPRSNLPSQRRGKKRGTG